MVGFPGRDLPARDQYVSGRYSGRLAGGLDYLPGINVYHAAIVELVTWLGLTAIGVCVGRGSLRVRPL